MADSPRMCLARMAHGATIRRSSQLLIARNAYACGGRPWRATRCCSPAGRLLATSKLRFASRLSDGHFGAGCDVRVVNHAIELPVAIHIAPHVQVLAQLDIHTPPQVPNTIRTLLD